MTADNDTAPRDEIDALWHCIVGSLDRLIATLGGLDAEGLNWRPAGEGTNSLSIVATHLLANIQENVLVALHDRVTDRDRESEFRTVVPSADALQQRWRELREQAQASIAALHDDDLDALHEHPRAGSITGRRILVGVACHAAEHLGEAELTRGLWQASRP